MTRALQVLSRLAEVVSKTSAYLGSAAILCIMLATISDVAGRSIFGASVGGAVETAELLLVAAAFLGFGLAQRRRVHVSMAVVMNQFSPGPRRVFHLVGSALLVAFAAWACWVSSAAAWEAFVTGDYRFGLVNVPTWPARACIGLGLLSLAFEELNRFASLAVGGSNGI